MRKGVLVSQDASGGGNLVVEKCAMTDAGVYTARGINEVGDVETSCTVTVTQPMEEPKFTSLLRSAKAVEGSPIKLEGELIKTLDFIRSSAHQASLGHSSNDDV